MAGPEDDPVRVLMCVDKGRSARRAARADMRSRSHPLQRGASARDGDGVCCSADGAAIGCCDRLGCGTRVWLVLTALVCCDTLWSMSKAT